MRAFISILIFLMISGCVSTEIVEYKNTLRVNHYSQDLLGRDRTSPKVLADEDISDKGIIVLRGKYEGQYFMSEGWMRLVFSDLPLELSGSSFSRLNGHSNSVRVEHFMYRSAQNSFLAIAIKPGVYSYKSTSLGPSLHSRFSPTRDINFEIKAGEAIYVGDVIVDFDDSDFEETTNLFGRKVRKLREDVIDFRFRIMDDYSAARQFYESIQNKPNWTLQKRIMTNTVNTNMRYYATPQCNKFWHSYSSGRGFC